MLPRRTRLNVSTTKDWLYGNKNGPPNLICGLMSWVTANDGRTKSFAVTCWQNSIVGLLPFFSALSTSCRFSCFSHDGLHGKDHCQVCQNVSRSLIPCGTSDYILDSLTIKVWVVCNASCSILDQHWITSILHEDTQVIGVRFGGHEENIPMTPQFDAYLGYNISSRS